MQSSKMMGEHENSSVLNAFDFAAIEEMDPSLGKFLWPLADGHKIIYEREVPFELRIQDTNGPQEVGTLEAIRVKLLTLVCLK